MATIVAVLAVLAATYIGLMQWRTAHYRLCFDLYEKRFKVYEVIKDLIDKATLLNQVIPADLDGFYEGIHGAEFLFDGKTRQFITDISQLAWKASYARARRQRNDSEPSEGLILEEQAILETLLDKNM